GAYGIAATPEGEVYFVSLANSYLARIDRATGDARVIEPPTPNQGARRVWSDSKGRLWVSEWNSGNLSMHDPKDGSWKTWKLPGEKPRTYAVYVDERDVVSSTFRPPSAASTSLSTRARARARIRLRSRATRRTITSS